MEPDDDVRVLTAFETMLALTETDEGPDPDEPPDVSDEGLDDWL